MACNCASVTGLSKYCCKFLLLCALGWGAANAQQQQARPAEVQIRTIPVANDFYVLTGRGTNTGVSAGEDGVALVNAGFANVQPKMVEAIAKITDKPIRGLARSEYQWQRANGQAWGGHRSS
jgi:hypothetical protein